MFRRKQAQHNNLLGNQGLRVDGYPGSKDIGIVVIILNGSGENARVNRFVQVKHQSRYESHGDAASECGQTGFVDI